MQLFNGSGGTFLGGVKEGQVSQQNQAVFVLPGQGGLVQRLVGHRQHLHAVLQHLVHNGMHAGFGTGVDGVALPLVLDIAAFPADLLHAALDDEQSFAALPDQHAGKPPVMVEGELVQFGVLLFQLLVMPLLPRHFPVPQDGVVQMVLYAGVIQAVQIGQVQSGLAFVSQNIHVIFQGDLVAGEGAGLVHT